MHHRCLIAAILVMHLAGCLSKDAIHLTVLYHAFEGLRGKMFQCYPSGEDQSATLSFDRYVYTRNGGESSNPGIEESNIEDQSKTYPNAKAVTLDTSNNNNFGVFSCSGSQNGKLRTVIPLIVLKTSAQLLPVSDVLTKTVNVGDENVSLGVRIVSRELSHTLNWRKDNSGVLSSWSGKENIILSSPITEAEGGVYECHYSNLRKNARQALQRLIVRACKANRWGPPACSGICDNCYNGGVCDAKTGKCICAPGFKGKNCLTGCGGNRFGPACEFKCTQNNQNPSNACRLNMYCLPDPYGCTCNTGHRTLACEVECEPGTFGAGCTQQCHCKSEGCNIYKGVCEGTMTDCEEGWSGTNCQIPPTCPTDYYGVECLQECRCLDDVRCNRTTGACSNAKCAEGYSVRPVEQHCTALPVYSTAPMITSDIVTSDTIPLVWRSWGEDTDTGLGPVTGYKIYYQRNNSDELSILVNVDEPQAYTLRGLAFDTHYSIRLAAVRNGSHGEGPKGPSVEETTLCGVPTPVRSINAVPITGDGSIRVTWEEATSAEQIKCYSAATLTTVYYKKKGESVDALVNASGTTHLLTRLEPFTIYVIDVTVSNKDNEGAKNIVPFEVYSPEKIPPPPVVTVTSATFYSVTFKWTTVGPVNLYGNIQQLSVSFRSSSGTPSTVNLPVDDTIYSGQIEVAPLDVETEYTFQFSVTNGVGESNMTEVLNGRTLTLIAPPAPLRESVSFSEVKGNKFTITWMAAEPPYVNGGITGYVIQYDVAAVGRRKRALEEIIVEISDADGEYTLEGLQPQTTYNVWVATKNAAGTGESTGPMQVTTTAASSSAGLIIGIIVVIIAGVLFVLLFLIIWKRRGSSKSAVLDEKRVKNARAGYIYENTIFHKENGENFLEPKASPVPQAKILPQNKVLSALPSTPQDTDDDGAADDIEGEIYSNMPEPSPIKVENLAAYNKQKKISKEDGFDFQFKRLPEGKHADWSVAEDPALKKKNRFKNIIPYNHSRVVLNGDEGDYYNASYIKDTKDKVAFIASQGPNNASIKDFWRLVWQQDIEVIVMLCNIVEGAKDKCKMYWPEEVNSEFILGAITVKLISEDYFSEHVERTIQISQEDEIRDIHQFHYLKWPDKDTPLPASLLAFERQVHTHRMMTTGISNGPPLLIHCSAGIGRTGTFIALHHLLEVMEREPTIDVFGFVQKMRRDRTNMIQTKGQYIFLHDALLLGHLMKKTSIPTNVFVDTYRHLRNKNKATGKEHLQEEYELLLEVTPTYSSRAYNLGGSPENRHKNRGTFLPMDNSIPFLSSSHGSDGSSYINASVVNTIKDNSCFITTQHPLENTVEDFWRLVYDWECTCIVMLNSMDPQQCVQYWPDTDITLPGGLKVTLISETSGTDLIMRQFSLVNTSIRGREREITQLQFTGWPAMQPAPTTIDSLNSLVEKVLEFQKNEEAEIIASGDESASKGRTLIHCLSGNGRSGVFLALWCEKERQAQAQEQVNIFASVLRLRGQVTDMINNLNLYSVCYAALGERLQDFSAYANYLEDE